MKSAPRAKSLKKLERVKGIEPSYSAWKSGNLLVFSKAALTFSVFFGPLRRPREALRHARLLQTSSLKLRGDRYAWPPQTRIPAPEMDPLE
jgi:hypothetical protein